MFSYLVQRVLLMIPTLIAISIITFVIIQLPPGDYLSTYIAELQSQGENVDTEKIEALRAQYGLDRPIIEQYSLWVVGMLQGDFGFSFEYQLPVSEVVGDRLFLTLVLNFATIIFIWIIAFPIGIYSATHQYSWGDYGLTFVGFIGLATPNFLLALVLLYLANVWFGTSIGGLMDPEYIGKPMQKEPEKHWLRLISSHFDSDPCGPLEGTEQQRADELLQTSYYSCSSSCK